MGFRVLLTETRLRTLIAMLSTVVARPLVLGLLLAAVPASLGLAQPPAKSTQVSTVPASAAAPMTTPRFIEIIGARAHVGERVVVTGVVTNFRDKWSERSPSKLTMRDASGQIEVVYWDNVREKLDPALTQTRTPLMVTGTIEEYKGALQLQVESVEAIVRVSPATTAASPLSTQPFMDMGSAVRWVNAEPREVTRRATAESRPILLLFHAPGSKPQEYLESIAKLDLNNALVFQQYVAKQVDVTTEEGRRLAMYFKVTRTPAFVVLDHNGNPRRTVNVIPNETTWDSIVAQLERP